MGRAVFKGELMKTKNLFKRIFWVFAALFLTLFCFVESAFSTNKVNAEEEGVVDYNSTQIEWDLQDIDSDDYPKDENGQHELIRFMEYCYSDSSFFKMYYGLYLYVYNPTEKEVKKDGDLNVANMAVSYNSDGEPSAYSNVTLTHLDSTSNNRFLKFKVTDSSAFLTRAQEYAVAHDGQRRYDIAGIQLYFYDGTSFNTVNYEDRRVAKSYIWTGFAKGCGEDYNAASTLQCQSQTEDVLSLDVKSTYYRPEGNNGTNRYTQDCLHSVYFAVPNKFIEKYGDMVAVHATWLEAVLKPALVTGNFDAYAEIYDYLGADIETYDPDLNYAYVAACVDTGQIGEYDYRYGYGYNAAGDFATCMHFGYDPTLGSGDINPLYMLLYSGEGTDSADDYIVSSKKIKELMAASYQRFGGDPVYGSNAVYSKSIFESVADSYKDENIQGDTEFVLKNQVLDQTWWEKWLGISHVASDLPLSDIKAIEEISESDLTREPSIDCEKLYIAKSDCEDFYKYFDENKENSTIYLFRYRTSEYVCAEANLYEYAPYSVLGKDVDDWDFVDTNAYIFQQAVDLNFEVIDVTFFDGATETVIPVVMSPMDIVYDATPPIDTTSDASFWDKLWDKIKTVLTYIVVGIGILIALVIVVPFIPYIVKFVVWLISLPFKLLGAVFKWIGTLFKKKNK